MSELAILSPWLSETATSCFLYIYNIITQTATISMTLGALENTGIPYTSNAHCV